MALDGSKEETRPRAEQLLSTKLYIPPVRSQLVPRPHLIRQLDEGLQRTPGMTLISAPAGFGKTTLVSGWISGRARRAAWLSLDGGENDPKRFFTYLVAALQPIEPGIGEGLPSAFSQPQSAHVEFFLIAFLNEIAAVRDHFILVLDDYHAVDSKAVDEMVAFLLEHMPPHVQVVIITREDPNLPLARLRARNRLTELRERDLRFSSSEAAEFLNDVMGLKLSSEQVESLEKRTEGWIAGLQLAALSMQGREDVAGFIKNFAGDHQYIVEYLVEEVLQHQPERVRSFLLQTSILDRLSGALCEAVTGQAESAALLDSLERGNLFVIPLDDKRRWFRYHHLFADVLRAHLVTEYADELPALHTRASKWYEQYGFRPDGIRHALAARDFERAARLVELAWSEMDRGRQSTKWVEWVRALPDDLIRFRPVLSVGYAWALLDRGELEAGEARFRDAESWLNAPAQKGGGAEIPIDETMVADREEFQALPASIASARAYHSLALGDMPSAVTWARQALDLLPEGDHLRRGIPASLLGLASWANAELEAAERSLEEAMASFQKAGNILFANTGTLVLADIRMTQGRLRQAFDSYQHSLQRAEGQGKYVLWGTADLHTGLSELLREQNDLEAAARHLLQSKELGEQASLPRWRFRWCIAQARVRESQGDLAGALEMLEEAEHGYVRGPVPDIRPTSALKARVWIKQGRLVEALNWVLEQGLSPDDSPSFLREFEHITLARVLIARYQREHEDAHILDAMGLLERLLKAAEQGGRRGSMIEILVLQALALESQGKVSSALVPLERALRLAESEGYVRIFVDEGIPMAHLLSEGAARGILPHYTSKLLTAFETGIEPANGELHPPATRPMIEPLSERELEVLRLISEGLSNREIGERLFLAVSTVKGYNQTIFGKLEVQRRTEAVARARELRLL